MTEVVEPSIATRSPAPQAAAFGGITGTEPEARRNDRPDFPAIQVSPEFAELRRRFRRFVFPMSALFFTWYLTYVLLAAYARDLMGHRIAGSVNVAFVLGLLQFVTTIAITVGYLRFARRRIDPQVQLIKARAGAARK
ncbi:MAG TPA: DUF485 domain-containing protein [Actinophytocola sp.]|uniref:DUF485 domain-containing protein n=1 Tax=Actinophytocola sp. TaxID=1872138 RepID=UPI002DDD17E0|nr:DUF485 domain-containing protein [Actinophytocola sp.]HEV2781009.1 DUF485 domain-containing protein [Actinophytocola sp.]